ncbi:MAG: response regulator transcription factor [Lachnospiraceae bacterium]|nr:response regulator transcription factor [Lachnospiraceae bacterium]
MKRIFFVEDDLSLINGMTYALGKEGYEVENARTAAEAEALWAAGEYDLVILDVALPDGTGFALCEKMRQTSKVPIMFLTAADEETDMIMGLDIGADDYITKPFKLAVFLSRIHALLRRSENFVQAAETMGANGITLDMRRGEVRKDGKTLELTSGEYRLLRMFMENPDRVLSAEQILASLWDCDENFIESKTLAVYIRRLRMKIEDDPGAPDKIVTVRGMGYKWCTGGKK